MKDNLTSDEIYDLYGCRIQESGIRSLYPYEDGKIKMGKYCGQDYTTTYDPLSAYALRKKYPVKVWGKLDERNHRAFVFEKKKPKAVVF